MTNDSKKQIPAVPIDLSRFKKLGINVKILSEPIYTTIEHNPTTLPSSKEKQLSLPALTTPNTTSFDLLDF